MRFCLAQNGELDRLVVLPRGGLSGRADDGIVFSSLRLLGNGKAGAEAWGALYLLGSCDGASHLAICHLFTATAPPFAIT